ncbi:MAG TPA: isoprenylcysteine carboxylmethyltransferase family protein [bacterium]
MDQQTPTPPRFYPPVLFLASLVLMGALHYLLPLVRWLDWPWRGVGAVPLAGGLLMGLWAVGHFRRRDTTIIPFEQSSSLILEGPYRLSRNPIYLSMVLVLLGVWLLLGSLSPALVVLLFVWWISTRFIVKEEQYLETQFGRNYLEYKENVRRWV